jgi:hypothetical protein
LLLSVETRRDVFVVFLVLILLLLAD